MRRCLPLRPGSRSALPRSPARRDLEQLRLAHRPGQLPFVEDIGEVHEVRATLVVGMPSTSRRSSGCTWRERWTAMPGFGLQPRGACHLDDGGRVEQALQGPGRAVTQQRARAAGVNSGDEVGFRREGFVPDGVDAAVEAVRPYPPRRRSRPTGPARAAAPGDHPVLAPASGADHRIPSVGPRFGDICRVGAHTGRVPGRCDSWVTCVTIWCVAVVIASALAKDVAGAPCSGACPSSSSGAIA